jgi:hypothetical protein
MNPTAVSQMFESESELNPTRCRFIHCRTWPASLAKHDPPRN